MSWEIEYYNEAIEVDILNLPAGLLGRYIHLTTLMKEFGSNLGMPHTKPIDNGLVELRLKSKEGIAHVFTAQKSENVLLCCMCLLKKLKKHLKKS